MVTSPGRDGGVRWDEEWCSCILESLGRIQLGLKQNPRKCGRKRMAEPGKVLPRHYFHVADCGMERGGIISRRYSRCRSTAEADLCTAKAGLTKGRAPPGKGKKKMGIVESWNGTGMMGSGVKNTRKSRIEEWIIPMGGAGMRRLQDPSQARGGRF